MRLLTFCPYLTLHEESIQSVLSQTWRGQNDIMLSRDNPHGDEKGSYKNIQLQYEKMRALVLERYDKVWIIESDIIAPLDALEKLMEVDADIVTGLYRFRQYADRLNIFNIDRSLMQREDMRGKAVVPCSGGAMGCVLIKREVFEGFSFVSPLDRATDGEFMRHCVQKKFTQVARLDVMCGHKTPEGVILWPEVN